LRGKFVSHQSEISDNLIAFEERICPRRFEEWELAADDRPNLALLE
jgi:hypothetical protein